MSQYSTRAAKKSLLAALPSRTLFFSSNTFFPYRVNELNKLNGNFRNTNSNYKFQNYLTKFIKVKENSAFYVSDSLGLKLPTRCRLNFSHLKKHKFSHNVRDTVIPMCSCRAGIETTGHYLLRCPNFAPVRSNFLNRISEINVAFRNLNVLILTSLLLFGSKKQTFDANTEIFTVFKRFWLFR